MTLKQRAQRKGVSSYSKNKNTLSDLDARHEEVLKIFSVGNWERHPEIPMLWEWKWKCTTEQLGICLVCLPGGKWVWKWLCREQHLHTSITNGSWSPHKTFSHQCFPSTGLRWASTPIICRTDVSPSARLSTLQIISSSLSPHMVMYVCNTHTPIKPLIHPFHLLKHTVQGHFITTSLLPEFTSFPLKSLSPLYSCFGCC